VPDKGLGQLGDGMLFAAVVLYAFAMLALAAEQATRRARRTVTAVRDARVVEGVGGPAVTLPAETVTVERPSRAGRLGLVLALVGWTVQLASITIRGFAADRVPWGNMYEFSSCVAWVAVTTYLVLVARRRVERALGVFILLPVVLYLGLAATQLYTEAGPLVPALNSYWIKIHVAAAIVASGAFLLSGVVAVLYLLRSRYDARLAARKTSAATVLPSAAVLDRVSYAVIAFAFPIWTFSIIAGAIWAEAAWGRYWGWDPKETWSFITWVLYAGYLHARATAGWKGRKAAWVAVAAAIALVVDYYVVNIFVVGLHSYA